MSVGKDKIATVMINMIEKKVNDQISAEQEKYDLKEKEVLKIVRDKEEELSRIYIEQELRELKNNVTKSVVKSRWDYKKALFIRRNELVDELFEDVKLKLVEFTKSKDYSKYIEYCLDECKNIVDLSKSVLQIREEDKTYFKNLPSGCVIEFDNTNLLGGFTCLSNELGIDLDYRIEKKLDEQRTWFINHSKLVIS